jgi:hypothetical protein
MILQYICQLWAFGASARDEFFFWMERNCSVEIAVHDVGYERELERERGKRGEFELRIAGKRWVVLHRP